MFRFLWLVASCKQLQRGLPRKLNSEITRQIAVTSDGVMTVEHTKFPKPHNPSLLDKEEPILVPNVETSVPDSGPVQVVQPAQVPQPAQVVQPAQVPQPVQVVQPVQVPHPIAGQTVFSAPMQLGQPGIPIAQPVEQGVPGVAPGTISNPGGSPQSESSWLANVAAFFTNFFSSLWSAIASMGVKDWLSAALLVSSLLCIGVGFFLYVKYSRRASPIAAMRNDMPDFSGAFRQERSSRVRSNARVTRDFPPAPNSTKVEEFVESGNAKQEGNMTGQEYSSRVSGGYAARRRMESARKVRGGSRSPSSGKHEDLCSTAYRSDEGSKWESREDAGSAWDGAPWQGTPLALQAQSEWDEHQWPEPSAQQSYAAEKQYKRYAGEEQVDTAGYAEHTDANIPGQVDTGYAERGKDMSFIEGHANDAGHTKNTGYAERRKDAGALPERRRSRTTRNEGVIDFAALPLPRRDGNV